MTSEWFPGEAWDAAGEEFLAELRRCADVHGLVDATPEDTTPYAWGEGQSIVTIDAPKLRDTPEKPTLEVVATYDCREPGLMSGWETQGYLADSCDPMTLGGAELTAPVLARHAFDWFQSELCRPLERAAWRTWWGGESTLVRYADTLEPVWGYLPRRRRDRRVLEVGHAFEQATRFGERRPTL